MPPALWLLVHLVCQIEFQHFNILLQSELIMSDAWIDLVHPFLSTLSGSSILTTQLIELFSNFCPLVRHTALTDFWSVLASYLRQNLSLGFCPVLFGPHNILCELPPLLTLAYSSVWHKYEFPISLCEIFWMSPCMLNCLENQKL